MKKTPSSQKTRKKNYQVQTNTLDGYFSISSSQASQTSSFASQQSQSTRKRMGDESQNDSQPPKKNRIEQDSVEKDQKPVEPEIGTTENPMDARPSSSTLKLDPAAEWGNYHKQRQMLIEMHAYYLAATRIFKQLTTSSLGTKHSLAYSHVISYAGISMLNAFLQDFQTTINHARLHGNSTSILNDAFSAQINNIIAIIFQFINQLKTSHNPNQPETEFFLQPLLESLEQAYKLTLGKTFILMGEMLEIAQNPSIENSALLDATYLRTKPEKMKYLFSELAELIKKMAADKKTDADTLVSDLIKFLLSYIEELEKLYDQFTKFYVACKRISTPEFIGTPFPTVIQDAVKIWQDTKTIGTGKERVIIPPAATPVASKSSVFGTPLLAAPVPVDSKTPSKAVSGSSAQLQSFRYHGDENQANDPTKSVKPSSESPVSPKKPLSTRN